MAALAKPLFVKDKVLGGLFAFLDVEVGSRISGQGQETPPEKVLACKERA